MCSSDLFKQQSVLKLSLPESAQAQKAGANDKESLEVSIGKDGLLRFGQNADVVTVEQLAGKLRDAVTKNPDVTLAINADENAPWGKVVKVRDAATEAKVKTLIAYTKEAPKP